MAATIKKSFRKFDLSHLLMEAVLSGNLAEVTRLVGFGADVATQDNLPLRRAAGNGLIEMVRYLLAHGADVTAHDNEAIIVAAQQGHTEIAVDLLAAGANVNAREVPPVVWAAMGNHADLIRILIEAGADVRAYHSYAMRAAARRGHNASLLLLLQAGSGICAQENVALRDAVCNKNDATVSILIAAGADLTSLSKINKKYFSSKKLFDLLIQYATTGYRGYEAVMLLDPNLCLKMLRRIHPEMKLKQIRDELAMMRSLGLDTAQMAVMWQSLHRARPQQNNTNSTLCAIEI